MQPLPPFWYFAILKKYTYVLFESTEGKSLFLFDLWALKSCSIITPIFSDPLINDVSAIHIKQLTSECQIVSCRPVWSTCLCRLDFPALPIPCPQCWKSQTWNIWRLLLRWHCQGQCLAVPTLWPKISKIRIKTEIVIALSADKLIKFCFPN